MANPTAIHGAKNDENLKQPFLLDKSKVGDVTKEKLELFVICYKKAIPISGNISMALGLLFYVFDDDYPEYLSKATV